MIKDMCEFRIDRLTVQLSINVKPHVVKQIDNTRGNRSRSGFINDCIIEHFTPKGEADINRIARLEDEVAYLRDQNTRMLDAVAQRLLTPSEPKRHWWNRAFKRT
jgi:hypothetical protein